MAISRRVLPGLAAVSACLGAGAVLAQEDNPFTYSNASGGSVTFYGQFSPSYLHFDDGEKSYDEAADNNNSNTRLGFDLDQELSNGLNLRFKVETALGVPSTADLDQSGDQVWDWERTDLRKFEMIMSGAFGAVSLGQGSMASDGSAQTDLSKTAIAGYVNRPDLIGGYSLRDSDGNRSDISWSQVLGDFDGGRRNRIRYDSPDFSGFSFAIAYGEEILKKDDDAEYYDIGAYYKHTYGVFDMAAGAGYGWKDGDGGTDEMYAASFSILHTPTGLNGTIAGGGEDGGGSYGYIKLGWIGDLMPVGYTAFSADYYSGNDFHSDGSDSESWGLQAVQYFEDINLEAYLAFSEYSFDEDGGSYKDASSTLFGVRWKF
ncbi:porin [Salipiger sp. H15]|uniref:Porin n=1 Tax=Alloyangia sp. H15 TaxID=3029062 RepID=A0AAU8AH44_9RHOB